MINLTKFLVSIFFVGYIKFAPGTWGTLVSLLIMYILFNILSLPLIILATIFIFLFFISNYLINYFTLITNSHDSKHIVIDELLGVFIIFLFYDLIFFFNDFLTYLLIFILFRFFDILKIFPANFFDKYYKNGYGVILDDIIAGLYTVLTLIILNAFI
ncbi:MAG: phosphatidylglycerophosphatase A [Alphaproteobacteria bacterium]